MVRTVWAGTCDATGAAASDAADVGASGGSSGGSPSGKLIVNVSPLTPGHFILAPFAGAQLPQVITADALLLGLVLVCMPMTLLF